MVVTLEKGFVLSYEVKYTFTIHPGNSTVRNLPKRKEHMRPQKTWTQMFIVF